MTDNVSKTLKGISSQTVVTIGLGILELLFFSIMSRLLTKTEFGYYAAIMSVIMIFRSLSEAGIGASVIQKINPQKEFVDTAFSLSIIVGFLFTFLVISFSDPFSKFIADKSISMSLCLVSLTLIPYSLNSIYRGMMIKKLHFIKVGTSQIIAFIIGNSVALFMALYGYGVMSVVIGNILNIFFLNILLYYSIPYKPHLRIYKKNIKEIVGYGGWLMLSRLTGSVYSQIDKILMAKWISISALGNFYRTKGLIDSIDSQVGGVFDTVLFPILSNIQDNKTSIQNAYVNCLNLGCIFFSYLFIVFFFNAKLIILLFLGEKWLDDICLFRLLSLSMLFYFITRLADCFIRSLALVRFGFLIKITSCLVLIFSIYSVVKLGYGIIGVAFAVIVTNLLSAIVKTFYICKISQISVKILFKSTVRGLLYSIPLVIIGLLFILFFENTVINSVLFAIIFLLVTIIIFLCFPCYVGQIYYNQLYPKVKILINNLVVK